ncbi:MAG: hypothetical protein C3F12_08045 [Candidatus Methylomirabilota bacterium]|nr:MAG: hypothetical protein C3F12_08045 [candidate division NC10 bacterium]
MSVRFRRFLGLGAWLLVVVGLTALLSVGLAPRTAEAKPEYFSGIGACFACHSAPTPATCQGCHSHGTHSSTAMTGMNVAGATNKTSYAPGEQVSVTITGGHIPSGTATGGWIRAILYDQTMKELVRSSGPTQGIGKCCGNTGYPITLTAPAPTTPGTYTWNVAWYGNKFDKTDAQSGTTVFGPRWTPDSTNPNHGQEIVATNSFTVSAPTAAAISLNPASLTFGTVNTGSTATLTAQIQNTGTATLNVTGIARAAGTSTEYTFGPAAPLTIPAGGSNTLSVTYTPTDAGTDTGSLAITSNASTSPTSLSLTGTGSVAPPPPGQQPAISLSLAALDFGTVAVGSPPAVKTTQIQNTGTAPLEVTGIAPAAGTSTEYTSTPAAPFTVAAGANTTLTVTYTPVDAGTDAGSLAITSNASTSPTSLSLTGTGSVAPPPPGQQPTIGLTPTSLDFGTVAVGEPAGELVTTIQNTGGASLEITGIALCAGTSAEFTWSPGTPLTVASGASAPLSVHYTPADAGADAGCLAIASNDPAAPSAQLAVAGTGGISSSPPPNPQPTIGLTPTALDFGTVVVGGSVSKTATITNLGTASLDVTSIGSCNASSAEFAYSPLAPFTLAPGAQQTVTISYAPTQAGTMAMECLVASNDPATPSVSVNLTAEGVSPSPAGGLNIELKHFRATKKVKIGRQVTFRLDIENEEDSSGELPASLVGIQNGVEVYNETITIFAEPAMEEARWSFPSYTPTAKGKITWIVTIVDDSSRTNQATAITKVKGKKGNGH